MLAALLVVLLPLAGCGDSSPAPQARPAADISVPPSLAIVADVPDSLLFSGASLKGDAATPLFRGRLTARSGGPLAAPARPAEGSLRIRVTRAPVAERGEDMTWIRPAPEPGVAELPKTAATAEYVYTGGDIVLHIRNDDTGKLTLVAEPAPPAPGKK